MTRHLPRGAVVGIAVGIALLVAAYAGGRPGSDGPPLDPRSDGPLGTSALVSVLQGLDAQVDLLVGMPEPDDDVALLLVDRLDEDQTAEVIAWVRDGGRLVVTDPGSSLAPPVAERRIGPTDDGLLERGTCTIDALANVETVDAGAAVLYDSAGSGARCFGDSEQAYVLAQTVGAGEVVALGGAAALTNELLGEDDNAVLAAELLVPDRGTVVRVVEAPLPAGGGEQGLADLVPPGVERALLQLGIAFLLYALWRSIRLGRPVPEHQPVRIAGSELVAAVGRLLGRTRSPGASAEVLRGRLRRELRSRMGLPASASNRTIAEAAAARSGTGVADVLDAVGDRPVTDDRQLLAVARSVSSIHKEVLR